MKRYYALCLVIAAFAVTCLAGCADRSASQADTNGTTTGTTENKGFPQIKDDIDDINDKTLLTMAQNYVMAYGFENSFAEGDVMAYDQAYRFIKYGGVYHGDNADIRPEMMPYYDKGKEMFTLPAKTVDEYVLGKFNTALDHSRVSEYNASDDTYSFAPFMGEFYYNLAIESQTKVDDKTTQFVCLATPDKDAWEEDADSYNCIFTIRLENREYKYVSVKITVDE